MRIIISTSTWVQNLISKAIASNPVYKRLVEGSFWSFLGSTCSSVLSLISSIILARVLGQQSFGELGIIQSTIGLFQVFAGFGLGVTATKYVAEYHKKDPAKVSRVLDLSNRISFLTGLLFATVFFFLSNWLSTYTLAAPKLSTGLRISAIILIFSAINGYQVGALQGFESFKHLAIINTLFSITRLIFMVVGVKAYGINGAIIGWSLAYGVFYFIYKFRISSVRKYYGIPSSSQSFKEWKVLIKFSLPAVLAGAMTAPVMWYCNVMIVNQVNGYSEMGLYNAAYQWWTVILFIPNTISSVILPILASVNSAAEQRTFNKILFINLVINGGLSGILSILFSLFAERIMGSYGPEFVSGSQVLILLVWAATLAALSRIVGQSIASKSQMWAGFLLNGFWAVTLIHFTGLFKSEGAVGLAKAMLLAYGIHFLNSLIFIYTVPFLEGLQFRRPVTFK